jgi:hypothetical protein
VSPQTDPTPGREEQWVDAFALEGGEGSRANPFKRVPTKLPAGVTLHLLSGLYEGPFDLPAGARVEGHGEVVLHATAPAVVVAGEALELVHVSVQGGAVGVRVTGASRLRDVRVSGHQRVGVDVPAGAEFEAEALTVEGTIPEALGLEATDSQVTVKGATFRGDLKRALKLEGGRATLEGVVSEGGRTLVHATGVELRLSKARAVGGTGPAVFLAGGGANVDGLEVDGHESALSVASGAKVDARAIRARGARDTGVVFLKSSGTLKDVEVRGAGPGGAVQLLESDVTLDDARLIGCKAMGIFVRRGRARLVRVVVDELSAEANPNGTRSLGDALMLRDAEVQVDHVTAREVEGSALFASAYATVTVGTLVGERTGGGVLFVERGATVRARHVSSNATLGPAVTVPDQATLDVERLVVSGGAEVPVYAACSDGALVRLKQLETTVPQPAAACVRVGP